MSAERTQLGLEVEAALNEVLSHVRGEAKLPCRIIADPPAERVRALRERACEEIERLAQVTTRTPKSRR